METIYWITEYVKVGLLYCVVMFLWPHVVFGKYLKDKSLTFRFGFCVTIQPLLISTAVLSLGLFHLLNPVSMALLFYGAVLVAAWLKMRSDSSRKKKLKKLLRGTYGFRSFLRNIRNTVKLMLEKHVRAFKKLWQTNSWEMVLVTILVIFGMCYFTHGVFRDHIFGFSDMFVHHSWTYQLTQGNIFSAGVYPEGMHCFVYALHTLFGVRIYSCLLFLPGFHIIVFLLSAYILFKEAFRWKYSGILALALFLMVDSYEAYEIHSMARLQCSLPQEFALYTLFLCAAFLVRYLKGEKTSMILEERKNWKFLKTFWWNDELVVFIFALATSLSVHFYPTIMAFFLCVAFVLPHLIKVFTKGRFKTLVVAVVTGVMIAVIPMAGALASGIPFQGSIGWAIGVIEGTEKEDKLPSSDTETTVMPSDNTGSGEMITSPVQGSSGEMVPGAAVQVQKPSKPSLVSKILSIPKGIFNKLKILYNKGYVVLYRGRAAFVVMLTLLAFAIWAVGRIVLTIRYRGFDEGGKERGKLDGYLQLVLGAVFFMVIYCAGDLGLPTLIEGNRILAVKRVMVAAVCVIPIDMVLASIDRWGMERIMGIIASAGVLCIYLGTMLTGSFHGFLYYELYNYSGAVSATRYITANIPKDKFTIVSPVEEIYQLIEYGYHEELIDFVNKSASEDYYLPTEYVFLFVEKHPLLTGQFHFFTGPGWLAQEKYTSYFNPSSQCPEIQGYDLSAEMAARPYTSLPNSNWVYQSIEARTILESRLYEWCREFDKLYPNELHTFYEDDMFICYYFKQNPFQLYNLGLQQ